MTRPGLNLRLDQFVGLWVTDRAAHTLFATQALRLRRALGRSVRLWARSAHPPMADASRDELIATTVAALRSHWRRVGERLRRGRWRPAEDEAWYQCFEADTVRRMKSLARRCSTRHVERVLALSDDALRAKISFYAEAAVAQAWEEYADEPVAQRRHMRSLTKSEYVLIEKGHSQADGTTNTWTVSEYPASVLHDDWYGRSVGASSYYEGYIMKSTGESFSKTEGEWLDAAVRQTTWQAPEFWQSVTIRESRNRILVALVPLTREDYVESLEPAFQRGTKLQVAALLRYLRQRFDDPRATQEIDRLLLRARTSRKLEFMADAWSLLVATKNAPEYLVETDRVVTTEW